MEKGPYRGYIITYTFSESSDAPKFSARVVAEDLTDGENVLKEYLQRIGASVRDYRFCSISPNSKESSLLIRKVIDSGIPDAKMA